jgi:hypothetical protein
LEPLAEQYSVKEQKFSIGTLQDATFFWGCYFWGLAYANLCAPLFTPIGHKFAHEILEDW